MTDQLFLLVVGFVLTTIVGGFVGSRLQDAPGIAKRKPAYEKPSERLRRHSSRT
jgi:hypothetical protein